MLYRGIPIIPAGMDHMAKQHEGAILPSFVSTAMQRCRNSGRSRISCASPSCRGICEREPACQPAVCSPTNWKHHGRPSSGSSRISNPKGISRRARGREPSWRATCRRNWRDRTNAGEAVTRAGPFFRSFRGSARWRRKCRGHWQGRISSVPAQPASTRPVPLCGLAQMLECSDQGRTGQLARLRTH